MDGRYETALPASSRFVLKIPLRQINLGGDETRVVLELI